MMRLLASLLLLAPLAVGAAPAAPYMGANLMSVTDYEPTLMFADAMLASRHWGGTSSPSDEAATLDANGWPTGDAGTVVMASQVGADIAGTYKLTWQGTGTPGLAASAGVSLANVAANSSDVVVTAGATNLFLTFSGTSGGVQNVKLMRPIAAGSATSHDVTETFSRAFLARLAHFKVARFMDYSQTNGNSAAAWTDRTLPSYATQNRRTGGAASSSGLPMAGAAWEYVILLANASSVDPWIDVPFGASDDYVTKLARLFRYGADANGTPYTSTQASPVWPPLDSARKLYVEFSNEVWNSSFGQAQAQFTAADAVLVTKTDEVCWDGCTSASRYDISWRLTAKRIKQISDLFRVVYGDAAMGATVRPVLAAQIAQISTLREGLTYLDKVYSATHPVTYYVWGAAGAPYWGGAAFASAGATADGVIAAMTTEIAGLPASQYRALVGWSKAYGLHPLVYESGLDTAAANAHGNLSLAYSIQSDSRLQALQNNSRMGWWAAGGETDNQYTLISAYNQYGTWGLANTVNAETSPRWLGELQAATATLPAVTAGALIPATLIPSNAWDLGYGYTVSTSRFINDARGYAMYDARVAADGTYTFTMDVSTNPIKVTIDGVSMILAVGPARVATATLAVGLHSIRVEPASTFGSAYNTGWSQIIAGAIGGINTPLSAGILSAAIMSGTVRIQTQHCGATLSQ